MMARKFYNSMKRIIEISAAENYNGLNPKEETTSKKDILFVFSSLIWSKKYI